MSYVNIHGEMVDIGKLATPKSRKGGKVSEATHKGYRVSGVSPVAIAKEAERCRLTNRHFDEVAWLRNAKQERITKKPCSTMDGAEATKALAERNGWRCVNIDTLAKGK